MDENNKYKDLFDEWRKFSNDQSEDQTLQERAIYKFDPTKPGERGPALSMPGAMTQGQSIKIDKDPRKAFLRAAGTAIGAVAAIDVVRTVFGFAERILSPSTWSQGLKGVEKGIIIGAVLKIVQLMTGKDADDLAQAAGEGSAEDQVSGLEDSSTGKKLLKMAGWTLAGGVVLYMAYKVYQHLNETDHPELKQQPKSKYSGLSASEWKNWPLAAQCDFCEKNKRKPIDHIGSGREAVGPACPEVRRKCKDLDKEVSSYSLVGVGSEEALMRMLYAETSWKRGMLEMAAICQIAVNRLKKTGKANMIDVVGPFTSGWNDASKGYARNFVAAGKRFKTPSAKRARKIIQNVLRGNSPVGDLNNAQNFIHPSGLKKRRCKEDHLTKIDKGWMCYDLAALRGGRRYGKTRIPLWSVHTSQGGTSKSIPRFIGTILISNGDRE